MKTTEKLLISLFALVLHVTTQLAAADTIQFENTTPLSQTVTGSETSYTESGYTIGNLTPLFNFPPGGTPGYYFVPPINSGGYGPASSSTFFACLCMLYSPTLSRTDGQLFSLHSLDIGVSSQDASGMFGLPTFTLTGQRSDSTEFDYQFTINDGQWHTLSFDDNPDFSNIKSLVFYESTGLSMALDNINVSQVPAPATAWLFGSGLIGLASAARRKNK
ncbi:MAG TPA: VPLPA-CTERM sorting domain-containing protein [Spongiibacteraceae bacterium]|nr:VPLPA-CTERM sorting domain-containing protein [Spongiibacteraceae bacterium]